MRYVFIMLCALTAVTIGLSRIYNTPQSHRTSVANFRYPILVCATFFLLYPSPLSYKRSTGNGIVLSLSLPHSLHRSRRTPLCVHSKQRPLAAAPLHTVIIYSLIIASFHNDNYYTCTHSNVNLLGTTGAPPSRAVPSKKWLCKKCFVNPENSLFSVVRTYKTRGRFAHTLVL